MTLDESAPVVLLLRLSPGNGEAGILLRILCETEARRLTAEGAEFVLRVWWESKEVARASITSVLTGNVAMLQGNQALRQLAADAGFRMDVV